MSVSECILNIQMLAQDDLKSFLKIAKKTFKFLEKNDYFYNCDWSLRWKFVDENSKIIEKAPLLILIQDRMFLKLIENTWLFSCC